MFKWFEYAAATFAALFLLSSTPFAYYIVGNTVAVEDANFALNQTPYLLTDFTQYAFVNITNKAGFSQLLDVGLSVNEGTLFDEAFIWTQNLERQDPVYASTGFEVVCSAGDVFSNYSSNSSYSCWSPANSNYSSAGTYDLCNDSNSTIYFHADSLTGYSTVYYDGFNATQFTSIVSHAGKTWVVLDNVNFSAGETKEFKFRVQTPPNRNGEYFVIVSDGLGAFGSELVLDPWFNAQWVYKQQLNLSSPAGVITANYTTVNASFDTASLIAAGKMQSDCDDLRVVYNDAIALDRHVLNCGSANTVIRFKVWENVGATVNQNYAVYYGNTAATAPSTDYTKVYRVYDDFDDASLNTTLWTSLCGTYTESSGSLKIFNNTGSGGGDDAGIRSNALVGAYGVFSSASTLTTFNPALDVGAYSLEVASNNVSYIATPSSCALPSYECLFTRYVNSTTLITLVTSNLTKTSNYLELINNVSTASIENHSVVYASNQFDGTIQYAGWLSYRNPSDPATTWTVYNASIWNYQPNQTIVFNVEEFLNPLTVTITSPLNATYIASSLAASFYFMGGYVSANCTSYFNGAWHNSTILANNTAFTDNVYGLVYGSSSYAVNCSNSTEYDLETVYFTSNFYNHSDVYDSTAYETTTEDVSTTIQTVGATFSNLNATLYYNNTAYAYSSKTNVSGVYVFNFTVVHELLSVNDTPYNFYFNLTFTYLNGTTFTLSTANNTQNVWFAYYINSFTASPVTVLMGDVVTLTTDLTALGSAVVNVSQYFNSTWLTSLFLGGVWVANAVAPTVITATTVYANESTLITFGGASVWRNATSVAVTVSPINLTTCYGSLPIILNFSTWNEENFTAIPADQFIEVIAWNLARTVNLTYNFSFYNVFFATICLGVNATIVVDSFQIYNASGFGQRYYFLDNATVSNGSTNNIFLYSQTIPPSKNTKIILKDSNGIAIKDAFVSTQRWYPGNSTYLTVAMVKTNNNGEGSTYLEPNDVFYKFVAVKDGVLLEAFSSRQVICDPAYSQCEVVLQVTVSSSSNYISTVGKISSVCAWNSATNYTTCTFVDVSGLYHYYVLEVYKLGILNHSLYCSSSTTASSGTLACLLSDPGEYSVNLVGYGSPGGTLFSMEVINGKLYGLFNNYLSVSLGALLALFLILTIMFSAWYTPATGVLMGGLGLVMASAMGFMIMPLVAIGAVIVFSLMVGWKLKQ